MDGLPDDVLISIFAQVNTLDLPNCRLVCRRFATLVLHPDVWRDRQIFWPYIIADTECVAALRLAPCVGDFLVGLQTTRPNPADKGLLFTAPCATKKLRVAVTLNVEGVTQADMLVKHHGRLGKLRDLVLYLGPIYADESEEMNSAVASLFKTVASTPSLEALRISGTAINYPPYRSFMALDKVPSSLNVPVPASLTWFQCCPGDSQLEPIVNAILTAHAATLRDVEVTSKEPWSSSPETALALAKMPHLTVLQCQVLPGMEALQACKSLTSLFLVMDLDLAFTTTRSAMAFLRSARQLRHVHIVRCLDLGCALIFVTALASSRLSCVETLCIQTFEKSPKERELQELLKALPLLPALEVLWVNYEPDSDAAKAIEEANPCLDILFAPLP